ncbi:MAG: FHA domain-containing protein [Leptolyngbyaceae cyanobacterium]
MPLINLSWNNPNHQNYQYQIDDANADSSQTLKIGRDQQKCELWIDHGTVSRIHAEIFFKPKWRRFYLRNLEPRNPVRVDGGTLIQGEVALAQGSRIQLGQMLVHVTQISLDDAGQSTVQPSHQVPDPTPQPRKSEPTELATQPPLSILNPNPSSPVVGEAIATSESPEAKLVCPKCHSLQPLSQRNSACTVCGHFLADAASKLLD